MTDPFHTKHKFLVTHEMLDVYYVGVLLVDAS